MKCQRVSVKTSDNNSELVAYMLHEFGSLGEQFVSYKDIAEVLNDKSRWDYAEEGLLTKQFENTIVIGFFDIEFNTELLKNEQLLKDFSVDIIDSTEWQDEWKKYYKTFNVGKLVIVPEWLNYERNDNSEVLVKLDPGLAFGTGQHETTRMCLEFLQDIDLKGKRVLDFGCGSGILGICAHALGSSDVVFIDNDIQAVQATLQNAKLNGLTANVIEADLKRGGDYSADIIVANITADILCYISSFVLQALKKGGYLILSGIINGREGEVLKAYSSLEKINSSQNGDWNAYLFKAADL